MNKEQFKTELQHIVKDVPIHLRHTLKLKPLLIDERYMAWTHCHHCGHSNQRLNCRYQEEFLELNHKCHSDGWECCFCGKQLDIYCGSTSGETCDLPFYHEVLREVKDLVLAFDPASRKKKR